MDGTNNKDLSLNDDLEQKWGRYKCLVCGYVYEGIKKLTQCPKCGNTNTDKFIEVD